MLLRLHRPAPPLDRCVELMTYFEGYRPDHRRERLLPDGAVEIVVDLTDTPKRLYDREDPNGAVALREGWASGMRRSWIVIEAAWDASYAVIRFRPGGAYPFLGFPVDELTDDVTELRTLLGERAPSLRDRVLEAPSPEAKLQAVERWLLEIAWRDPEPHPVAEYLAGQLHDPGSTRIRDLVGEIGFSHKHVVGTFRKWVGLSPKLYCRIRRFQQVVHAVQGLDRVDWSEIAHRCGYYDQAHFIRDFKQFSGYPPTRYLSARGEFPNYLPQADG